ncbi:MAG: ATP-binding cassette domain-containing protein [Gammaproteobacteria bacterium]|nr:ATP-binding cassette domain-containing protein [Gammaproteobacteria bacterium]
MLTFTDVSLRRGPRPLFENASFTIHAGNKVGITGANGCGKSSLFSLIRNELHADTGTLRFPADSVIAHVAQESPAVEKPAIEYVIDGDSGLRELQAQLTVAEQNQDGLQQAQILSQMEAIDAYTATARAARLLNGLGFTTAQQQLAVDTFSGGWRMRLNLAQALMCRSDILLLDEPTNHLDLDAVIWLESWLQRYHGTLLLVSHDRDFLDRIVNRIAHMEQQRITLYTGNYTAFEQQRAEQLAQQQAAHEKQQREVAHMRAFVDRFRAKATKARQAQSRLKALERMALITPAHVDSPFHFTFPPPEKLPQPLLQLEDAAVGYEQQPLLQGLNLSLAPGDRIGLLGPNGAGKSTLIKLLAGTLQALTGKRQPARYLQLGYFAQHQLEQLEANDSPLAHLQRLDKRASEKSLRDFLGGFGFQGDRALEPVAPFSGGEKARLVLALLVYQKPNLLLLDEPTNHLDLEMRLALSTALQDYQGAMVIISHDRHLLRTVTDQFYLVHAGRLAPFDGDLEDYRQYLQQAAKQDIPDTDTVAAKHTAEARKSQRREAAEKRQRLQPLRKEIQQLEKSMASLESRKNELETQLADTAVYEDANKANLKALLAEQADIQRQINQTEESWLTKSEELQGME